MPTNEERREIARKLRGEKCGFAGWVGAVYIALEVDGETAGCDMLDLLADLIEPEPTVDRDALLALARDLEVSIMESGACGDVAVLVLNIVKQIREACDEVK